MLVVLNVGDSGISDNSLPVELAKEYAALELETMRISAQLEMEIMALEDEKERREFMRDAGIDQPALNVLSALAIKTLGLISFFTVGQDEVRQWQLQAGSSAPRAAGKIHTDIEHGFIRAEVIKYDDLMSLGSEDEVKKAGKLQVMGKDYLVQDGDIINFRFNV